MHFMNHLISKDMDTVLLYEDYLSYSYRVLKLVGGFL